MDKKDIIHCCKCNGIFNLAVCHKCTSHNATGFKPCPNYLCKTCHYEIHPEELDKEDKNRVKLALLRIGEDNKLVFDYILKKLDIKI